MEIPTIIFSCLKNQAKCSFCDIIAFSMMQKTVISPDPKSFYNHTMPDKVGEDYEHARWHANPILSSQYRMMVDVLRRAVTPTMLSAQHVLEIGPGPGTWTAFLLEANPHAAYELVDISREMLGRASKNLAHRQKVSFVESDLLALEPSQLFDFFFSSRAIEYMPDKRAAVQKIASLLVSDARGVIITKMPKPFFDRVRGRAVSPLHGAQIAPRVLARLLRENGFVVEKVRVATATVPLIGSALLNRFAYAFLKHIPLFFPLTLFAESYLITFRKQP